MIAVLMGGWSKERAISLQSGKRVYQALQQNNIPSFAFDVTKENLNKLWQRTFDKAFIMLHGIGGEDGFIQAELAQRNIAYTGADASVSKLALDKIATKQLWQRYHLPTPPSIVINKDQRVALPDFPLPWAIKPVLEGSSFGISKVSEQQALNKALKLAFQYDDTVLIEQWIDGRELTVGILEEQSLPIVEIICDEPFFDYHAKYISPNTRYLCPAPLDRQQTQSIQQLSLQAFQIIGARHFGRIDLMLASDNTLHLLEINTIPGMTDHSLVPMAASAAGIDFAELVTRIANARR